MTDIHLIPTEVSLYYCFLLLKGTAHFLLNITCEKRSGIGGLTAFLRVSILFLSLEQGVWVLNCPSINFNTAINVGYEKWKSADTSSAFVSTEQLNHRQHIFLLIMFYF